MAALEKEHRLLQAEEERSERLLLNILPPSIAQRLKLNPGIIADAYDEVTVLFADIVGFTPLTQRIAPDKMVQWLNEVFLTFDRLADRYDLEKIRTIGDSYMVVGGAPISRADHAEAVAEMALDMRSEIAAMTTPDGDPLNIRIGINSGPAIAAVIGARKFIYDIYGDTVNTASRMESHGLPGCIQVAEDTYSRLRDRYIFEERGPVYVKGKGEMATYILTGRKVPVPA
jgi:class 3 adenylate cyclase